MTRQIEALFLSLVVICICGEQASLGQSSTGLPSFGSFQSGQIDTINENNLNVHLSIPLFHKAGRGFPLNFQMAFDSSDWTVVWNATKEDSQWQYTNGWGTWGVAASIGQLSDPGTPLSLCPDSKQYLPTYTDSSGTIHGFGGYIYPPGNCGGSNSATLPATDGSGYVLIMTNGGIVAYDRSGDTIATTPSITDPNGNSLSLASNNTEVIDTLGMTALTQQYTFINNTTISYTYYYTGPDDKTQETIVLTYTQLQVASNFGCNNYLGAVTEYGPSAVFLPTSILLADGSTYGFQYESNGKTGQTTGRVSEVILPTGGDIQYTYASWPITSTMCTEGSPQGLTRTTSDGAQWQYSRSGSGNFLGNVTTLTDPAFNQTVITFGYTSTGLETQRVINQGSSTLLETVVTCYNGNFASCASAEVDGEAVTELDVYRTPANGTTSLSETFYNSSGLLTRDNEFDYGINTGKAPTATPLKSTMISYASLGNYINDRPSCIQTTAGSSPSTCGTASANTVALTTNQYDSLGNLKETSSWVSGSNFLTKSFTYYPDGLPETMTDVNSNITSYGAQDCGPNNKPAFTSTVASGRLTTTTTWDCYGGVPTQFSDANNKNTKYGYDTLWRRTSVTDPLGYVTNTVYTPATATTSATVENYLNFPVNTPTSTVDTLYTLDGLGRFSGSEKRTAPGATTFDGAISYTYGWNSKAGTVTGAFSMQTVPGATGVTTTQMDAIGRTASIIDGGGGSTAYTYDQKDVLAVLGPAAPRENLNQVQYEYDALGRVTSSCAVSGKVTGTVKCGQTVPTSPATGILTSTLYSTTSAGSTTSATRGVQTRSSTTDGIGRVTSSTTPEGGTTTYTYDGAACGSSVTYPGHLIQMNFANGSSQCFEYDSLGRLTRSAGATSSGSAYCKSFLYDNSSGVLGALPPGISPQYPLGRLVEAETDTCAWPITSSSIITDEWFSYDADGHATDIWELTPHSGGSYYHSTATYAGNGVVTSLVLANPSIATETYGLDGEGRLTSLSSGTHTIVSGVQYNTSSQPPTINVALGTSTDQDTYTYNPKTGRMTNWTFQVGSTPATETGALTWNPNGTLEELAIVDGFNSGGTQNCYYNSGLSPGTGYDDLGRLVGVNCTPSAWSQTFTYDQYDNLTKSGSMAWNPGYDPTTNHYQLAGTSYDLSGNVTNDSSNSYAWDQFNKMASVNSTACGTNGNCATYDAFGRMVEFSKNSIYKENWYTQSGTVVMSGTTLAEAYLVAPGGGTFMELGGQNDYLHKDWLGNARIASLISAQTVGADLAYAPYGEVYNFFSGSGIDWMFTGDLTQLDSEYLWDTPNREFAGKNQGRWLSPDPAGAGWNQYAYATNPMSNVDPSGLVCYPLEKILTGGCGAFMNNGVDFGANWDEFYILNAAYSGSYETPDPSKPWLPMGALDGQIIVGGCTGAPGCQDFEVPQMMTVYPNIGLLSMLFVTPTTLIQQGTGPGTQPNSPPSKAKQYLSCVLNTAADDAAWGGIVGGAIGVGGTVVVTGAGAIAGSSLGPEGTIAGAGLGFGLSAPFIVPSIAEGAIAGAGTGLIHGGIACLWGG